ncbi:MAG: phage holin family protein [Acidimicrobiia bacterium]
MSAPVPEPGTDRDDLPHEGTGAFPGRDTYAMQQHADTWEHEVGDQRGGVEEASIGELVGRLTRETSDLVRAELELARVEMKEEATKAGKAGGLLAGGAAVGYVALILLAFAAAWGLAEVIEPGWAFLVMGAVVGLVAAVLALIGRNKLRQVSPMPEQTMETLKEDARWARTRAT